MKWTLFIGPVSAILAASLVATACGGSGDDASSGSVADAGSGTPVSSVTMDLTNWEILPSSRTLAAGKVSFTAVHEAAHHSGSDEGGATHQMLVGRLPDGEKAGQSKFANILLNLTEIKPGESKSGEAELTPGTYEIACLVVEQVNGKAINHYEKGMYTTVVVK